MAKAASKFAGMFGNEAGAAPEPQGAPPAGRTELLTPTPARLVTKPLGRPPGKRSDPAWKQFSVLIRKTTQRQATDILRDRGEGDFSGLVQSLVEDWVNSQKQ